MGMRNERGLHLCPNRKEKLHISTGMYSMYSSYAVYVVQHLMLISQKTLQVRLSSCHFSHIHLFIAVHHLWDLGRKLLNMVSTDTCTCIHQHYFSGVIVDLLFCLCLKEDEASWWRYQWPPIEALLPEPIRYLLWRLHSRTALLWQLRCYGP